MKIRSVSYKNFRNFYDEARLQFDTTGKINIIYGMNGDGKTTFHQLCRWIFYGKVQFNDTSAQKELYNNAVFNGALPNAEVEVRGEAEFEHQGVEYVIKRSWRYTKGSDNRPIGSPKTALMLLRKTSNSDWKPSRDDDAQDLINRFLPESLSDYFFFDGEGMIKDIKKRGEVAAENLRKGIYYLFKLQIYDNAIQHIGLSGATNSTVLGRLHSEKAGKVLCNEAPDLYVNYQDAKKNLDIIEDEIDKVSKKKQNCEDEIEDLDEQTKGAENSTDLVERRQKFQKENDDYEKEQSKAISDFGKTLSEVYSRLLVVKRSVTAKQILFTGRGEGGLPLGLSSLIVKDILKKKKCICGRDLSEAEEIYLKQWLDVLPPVSYQAVYERYMHECRKYLDEAIERQESVRKKIKTIHWFDQKKDENVEQIKDIDFKLKTIGSIEKLVTHRQELENEKTKISQRLEDLKQRKTVWNIAFKAYDKKIESAKAQQHEVALIDKKIQIVEDLRHYFEDILNKRSNDCRVKLQENINRYLKENLTTNRNVDLSERFVLKVTDEFDNEYKSEGQFAVVSFCYILGILSTLKMLDDVDLEKDYPLLLDGPFSKLDPQQQRNIVNCLPKVAPQVIILSKMDLSAAIADDHKGQIYCIESNVNKNKSRFMPANDQDVKYYFSKERADELERQQKKARGDIANV